MAEVLALPREELIWVVKETTTGTLAEPVAADMVLPIEPVVMKQMPEQIEDNQTRNSRSRFSLIQGRTLPGEWQIKAYIKPSGSLGVTGELDTLMTCAMGVETVNASTSVVYTFSSSTALPTFSLWRKLGHHFYVARGCIVNKVKFEVSGKDIGMATFSGQFMEMTQFSEDTVGVGGIDGSATTLPVTNGNRFYVPASTTVPYFIKVDTEVMKVTGRSGNNLTVVRAQKSTVAAAHLAAATVTAWTPGTAETGSPVHGKFGAVTVDAVTTVLLDVSIDLETGGKIYTDEKDGSIVGNSIGTPGKRKVSVSSTKYLRVGDNRDFEDALLRTNFAMIVNLGDTAGRIVRFTCPTAQKAPPDLSGGDEVTSAQTWNAIATTGDAEFTVTFI